jgi:hypothetical protein
VESKVRYKVYWVPGCMIDDDGNVMSGARLFTTAKGARRHTDHSPCGAKAVRVRVSREDRSE